MTKSWTGQTAVIQTGSSLGKQRKHILSLVFTFFLHTVPESSTLLSFIIMRLSGIGRRSPDEESDDDDDSAWSLVQQRKQITERIIGRRCISASQQGASSSATLLSWAPNILAASGRERGSEGRGRGRGQRAKLLFAHTFSLKAIFQKERDKSAKKSPPLILAALLSATSPLFDFQH